VRKRLLSAPTQFEPNSGHEHIKLKKINILYRAAELGFYLVFPIRRDRSKGTCPMTWPLDMSESVQDNSFHLRSIDRSPTIIQPRLCSCVARPPTLVAPAPHRTQLAPPRLGSSSSSSSASASGTPTRGRGAAARAQGFLPHPRALLAPDVPDRRRNMADRLTRIAIVNEDRCKPKKCRQECKKSCPVVKIGKLPPSPPKLAGFSFRMLPRAAGFV
jgi:hypothetical protein